MIQIRRLAAQYFFAFKLLHTMLTGSPASYFAIKSFAETDMAEDLKNMIATRAHRAP
jgi:hypothetical protein